jgi:hypothetical protein
MQEKRQNIQFSKAIFYPLSVSWDKQVLPFFRQAENLSVQNHSIYFLYIPQFSPL